MTNEEWNLRIAKVVFGRTYIRADTVTGWAVDGSALELPDYVTRIGDAWDVVEQCELFSEGRVLHYFFDAYRQRWQWGISWSDQHGAMQVWAAAETAPRVICLGVLRLLGDMP